MLRFFVGTTTKEIDGENSHKRMVCRDVQDVSYSPEFLGRNEIDRKSNSAD